jgi:antirestriction protein ArdC
LRGIYPSQVFGTFNAWKEAGAQVRKGEKGIPVIFWKPLRIKDKESGNEKEILFARGFTVFAAEQVDNFDLVKFHRIPKLPNSAAVIDNAELRLRGFALAQGIAVNHGGNRAFYAPASDSVQLPGREQFTSTGGYYSTLAHELVHATGHEKRLNRAKGKRFGDSAYAFEQWGYNDKSGPSCSKIEERENRSYSGQHH